MTTSEAKFSIRFDSLDIVCRSEVLVTEMSKFHSACVLLNLKVSMEHSQAPPFPGLETEKIFFARLGKGFPWSDTKG